MPFWESGVSLRLKDGGRFFMNFLMYVRLPLLSVFFSRIVPYDFTCVTNSIFCSYPDPRRVKNKCVSLFTEQEQLEHLSSLSKLSVLVHPGDGAIEGAKQKLRLGHSHEVPCFPSA
jgi:hypothetical protein